MFGIEPSEFLLVGIVALVVIGPKDLPRAMRVVGQWIGRARGMARHFRTGYDEMVRQAELEEMEKRWAAENARIMAEHPNPAPEALSAPPPEEAQDVEFARPLPSPAESVEPSPAPLPTPEEPAPAPEPKPPARARKAARKADEPATTAAPVNAAPDAAPPADQPGLPFGTSEKPADRG